MAISYLKHSRSKILGQDHFVKQTELKSHSPPNTLRFAFARLSTVTSLTPSHFRSWRILSMLEKTNTLMTAFEMMNLKSPWLHFQQLQAFCAFQVNLRWHEQVKNNLLWNCFPVLIIPVISRRSTAGYPYMSCYVWDRKQHWAECYFLCSPSPHQLRNTRIRTFTYTATCVYLADKPEKIFYTAVWS